MKKAGVGLLGESGVGRIQCFQCIQGCSLLSLFFCMPKASAEYDAVVRNSGLEPRVMHRTGNADNFIDGESGAVLLEDFLQSALGILHGAVNIFGFGPETYNDFAGFLETTVEIDSSKDRFHYITQNAGFLSAAGQFFAMIHEQGLTEPQRPGNGTERIFAYKKSTQMGQIALLVLWVSLIKSFFLSS